MTEQTTTRPATITASEFVEQGYAEKIDAGECVVYREEMAPKEGYGIGYSIVSINEYRDGYSWEIWHKDGMIEPSYTLDDEHLFVTWLQPQPPTETPTATEAATVFQIGDAVRSQPPNRDAFEGVVKIVGDKGLIVKTPDGDRIAIMSETVKITASEQATAAAAAGGDEDEALNHIWENHQMVENIGISYDIYVEQETNKGSDPIPFDEWLIMVINGMTKQANNQQATIARLEAALTAANEREKGLTSALQKIASKSDIERPEKLNGEDDFSFGITRGLWRCGVIAREVLEQAVSAVSAGEGEES